MDDNKANWAGDPPMIAMYMVSPPPNEPFQPFLPPVGTTTVIHYEDPRVTELLTVQAALLDTLRKLEERLSDLEKKTKKLKKKGKKS